jgi:hypothetical protein
MFNTTCSTGAQEITITQNGIQKAPPRLGFKTDVKR